MLRTEPVPPRFFQKTCQQIDDEILEIARRMSLATWWRNLFDAREKVRQTTVTHRKVWEAYVSGMGTEDKLQAAERARDRATKELDIYEGDHAALLWYARAYCHAALLHLSNLPSETETRVLGRSSVATSYSKQIFRAESCIRSAQESKKVADGNPTVIPPDDSTVANYECGSTMTAAQLAKKLNLDAKAVSTFLSNYRKKNPDCAVEVGVGQGCNKSRFLYHVEKVLPALQQSKLKTSSAEYGTVAEQKKEHQELA